MSTTQERARASRKDAGAARRNQLLAAAAECFDEFGYSAVTVEMIANRAHTSRPTFYAYFRSKDEVFLALVEKLADELNVTQSLTGLEDAGAREILAATTRAYLDAIFSMGGIVGLIDVTASVRPEVAEIWTSGADRRIRGYARFLRNLPGGTLDPAIEPERLVQIIGDAIHHGAKRLAGADEEAKERFVLDIIAVTERLLGLTDDHPAP
ncbi:MULTISPECIES: TetR/AcrR family transcriptional regulator [Gordonia]|uniref:TetR/AcrR family transcriptional regulator n=1 Tax=Gordonia TaxID=2053 RepID=UPI000C7CE709|nr:MULTISPECIES: TetR/AcrR family transcriptional regulator [Gordonia]AUH69182.1 TetR/AcrR family transcriptional regulator [Gordonia sp. YC-JH1]WFN94527.1 helix-turn-helix domain containing protein [Gordonia sihwensis]